MGVVSVEIKHHICDRCLNAEICKYVSSVKEYPQDIPIEENKDLDVKYSLQCPRFVPKFMDCQLIYESQKSSIIDKVKDKLKIQSPSHK